MLDLLPGLNPGAGLQNLIVVCIGMADMRNNSKLDPTS